MSAEQLIDIRGEADILAARRVARLLATELGFDAIKQIEVATAISEIARNTITYAGRGQMRFAIVREQRRTGIRVVATDSGPGITNLSQAMSDGFSTGGGLGLGLPGARRLMDGFEIRSEPGDGTTITMMKWGGR